MKKIFSTHKAVLVAILLLLCLTGALASFAAVNLSNRLGLRLDMTDNRLYELSEQTKSYLAALQEEVQITVLSAKEAYFPIAGEMLARCEKSSPYLTVSYIDPYVEPMVLEQFRADGVDVQENDMIVQAVGGHQIISYDALYTTDAAGETVKTVRVEKELVTAINRLLFPTEKTVLFTQGHNEEIPRSLQEIFTTSGFRLEQKALQLHSISETTNIVVIANPSIDFTAQEISALQQFLLEGGDVMLFLGSSSQNFPQLEAWCAEWGLVPAGGMITDATLSVGGNPANPVGLFTNHPVNQVFESNQIVPVLPYCRPIEATSHPVKGVKVSPLMVAGSGAVASGSSRAGQDLWMIALAEKENGAALLFAGSGQMLGDDLLQSASYANALLLQQSIEYLCPDTTAINIPEKQVAVPQIVVLPHQMAVLLAIIVGMVCALVLTGAAVVLARRYRT